MANLAGVGKSKVGREEEPLKSKSYILDLASFVSGCTACSFYLFLYFLSALLSVFFFPLVVLNFSSQATLASCTKAPREALPLSLS